MATIPRHMRSRLAAAGPGGQRAREARRASRESGGPGSPGGRRHLLAWVVVALVYLGVVLLHLRGLLANPSGTLPQPEFLRPGTGLAVDRADQAFVVWAVVRSARMLASRPWELFGDGQCFPFPRPHTLGEHAFGEALLAVLPLRVSGSSIVAFNTVVLLALWIPAMTMYALVRYWTGSHVAAFVAGLLFALEPARLGEPSRPFVHGDHWTPLVLLFAQKLFEKKRWRDVLGFTASTMLQLFESFYQVLAMTLLFLPYGLRLAVRYAGDLRSLLPKLAVAAALLGAWAGLVFGPYLETRHAWHVLQGRQLLTIPVESVLLPRRFEFAGWVALTLAAIGLLDRTRGPRAARGHDPRLSVLAGGLLAVWFVSDGLPLPWTDWAIPSPVHLAYGLVPGLDAVRSLPHARMAFYLAASFLGGYGVLALVERLPVLARLAVAGGLALAVCGEVLVPDVARRSFGRPLGIVARPLGLQPDATAFYEALPPGPVLDLPSRHRGAFLLRAGPHYLLGAARHGEPIGFCYNSFIPPLSHEVESIASRASPEALDELYRLGFRTLIVHDELLSRRERRALTAMLSDPVRAVPALSYGSHRAFRLAARGGGRADTPAIAGEPGPQAGRAEPRQEGLTE